MAKLKEKDVVDYIVRNWDTLFKDEELFFYKTEYKVTDNWRADILAYVKLPSPDNPKYIYRAPVYIEVKFDHNYRDLIYELEKGLNYIHRKDRDPNYPRYLAVIVDDTIDATTLEYIKSNQIPCYMYTIENEDLTTLNISMCDN